MKNIKRKLKIVTITLIVTIAVSFIYYDRIYIPSQMVRELQKELAIQDALLNASKIENDNICRFLRKFLDNFRKEERREKNNTNLVEI